LNVLTLDVETDTYNKGNPFDDRNKLVCVAYKQSTTPTKAELWGSDSLGEFIQALVDYTNMLVMFNGKFDYHWLHNNGVDLRGNRIWDC